MKNAAFKGKTLHKTHDLQADGADAQRGRSLPIPLLIVITPDFHGALTGHVLGTRNLGPAASNESDHIAQTVR